MKLAAGRTLPFRGQGRAWRAVGPLDADPSPRRYLRHRGRSPAPRRARRSPTGSSAAASPPRAREEPCVAAGRTMPRQPLSGTVLLAAALLLAGKAPTTPVVPPSSLSGQPPARRDASSAGVRGHLPLSLSPHPGEGSREEMLAVWRNPPKILRRPEEQPPL